MPRVLSELEIIKKKPRELLGTVLPTEEDVIRAIHYIRTNEGHSKTPWKNIEKTVSLAVQELWEKSSVPTIQPLSIRNRVSKLSQEFLSLLNTDAVRKEKPQYIKKIEEFRVSFPSQKWKQTLVIQLFIFFSVGFSESVRYMLLQMH